MISLRQRWWLFTAPAVVIMFVILAGFHRTPAQTVGVNTNAHTDARAAYASLYESAWRQDSGQGNTLVTATLMLPNMVQDLGQDSGRSTPEDQLYNATKDLPKDELAIFVTIDSVNGAVPDDVIKKNATLTVSSGQKFSVVTWTPFIGASHVVNTSESTSYQSGVLLFQANSNFDWNQLRDVRLSVSKLDVQNIPHEFTWVNPSLLLQPA